MTKNIKNIHFGKYHFLLWYNKQFQLKYFSIKTKFYRKYSLRLGRYICEVGWLRYEGRNHKHI